MMKTTFVAALALAAGPAMAQQKAVRIGFISTFSGPTAVIGNDMRNSFELGLDHLGRKLGGLPVEVIYEDDTQKPDVGLQKTQKLVESDHVDFVVGYIWSNVLLASLKPLVDSKTMTVVTNAGASQFAGELCSPYVFSTSWQNDQTPEAMGLYMNQKGVKSAFLVGPNYAAGRDMLAGLKLTYKGKIIGEEYTRWPDQLDFSAELSKAREAKPDAIFVFYPAAPAFSSSPNTCRQASTDEFRSTRFLPSTSCRCHGSKIWRSAFPARRNGSTTCPTKPIESSSPTISPSTTCGRRSTPRRPTTQWV